MMSAVALLVAAGMIILSGSSQGWAADRAAGIYAGAAERDISPPLGMEITHPVRKNVGIHDPLFVRVLVLEDAQKTSVAIITADLLCAAFSATDELRERVKQQTGVSEVWFNCSHTHASRWLLPASVAKRARTDQTDWDEAADMAMAETPETRHWNAMVHQAALEIVVEAKEKLVPAILRSGRAKAQVGFNRRLTRPDGHVTMAVNREGPVVPWVNVLVAESREAKKPIAVLFEHPAHPVSVPDGSRLVSADFPGAAVARIRDELGKDVIAMYGQGCNGNINSYPLRQTHALADAAGRKLGEAALLAIRQSEPIKATTLALRTVKTELPSQPLPSPPMITDLMQKNVQHPQRMKQLRKIAAMRESGGMPPPRRFDVSSVRLGDEWCLMGMPYELFCDYELWIDQHAPFRGKMVLGLTNGGRAYIGTDQAWAMGANGGYEAGSLPNWGGHETMSPNLGPPAIGSEGIIKRAFASAWR